MKVIDVQQGSAEWHAARAQHLCASEAPVMMGVSPYTKRTELVRQKATGDTAEINAFVQSLFDRGHETEARARLIVEERIGEDLYPVTGESDDGRLLASFDGITMSGKVGYEHKLWNEELAVALRAGQVPETHYWQLEQQIHIGGLDKIIFVCSDGTPDKFISVDYVAVPGRFAQLSAGWDQFEDDVRNFKHVDVAPAAVGKEMRELPALMIQLSGKVKNSNLEPFRMAALAAIKGINTELKTDQDFADAAKTVTFLKTGEEKLDAAKAGALEQTVSIADLFRTLDELRETMRSKRLELDKLVEARKKAVRAEILSDGQTALADHILGLNKRLGGAYIPVVPVPANFAEVMKGKKTVASLRDAVDTELAHAKIASNAIADKIQINLQAYTTHGVAHAFLFADLNQLLQKENDAFEAMVKMRVSDHREQQAKAEAEQREKIRQEEQAKLAATAATATTAAAAPVQPAPPPAPNVVNLRAPQRPADVDMVNVLAAHYRVPADVAVGWMRTFNAETFKAVG